MKISWNTLEVAPPPTRSVLTKNIGITNLKQISSNFQKVLENQNSLHLEAALLSRSIYRMKTKFRHDKGLKTMEKVNRCLLQYLKLNLAAIYKNFTSCIRVSVDGLQNNEIYAPTKQMLQYLLLRTQGFGKLVCRMIQLCKTAAKYLLDRLALGQSWNVALIQISIAARLWSISRYLVMCACEHYNELVPFLEILQLVGVEWVDQDFHFPKDLKLWLNEEWINANVICAENGNNRIADRIKNVPLLNKLFFEENDESSTENIEDFQRTQDGLHLNPIEIGEPVSRAAVMKELMAEDCVTRKSTQTKAKSIAKKSKVQKVTEVITADGSEKLTPKKTKKVGKEVKSAKKDVLSSDSLKLTVEKAEKKRKKQNAIDKIKSAKGFMKFLKGEEGLRVSNRGAAVTRELDNLQFHILAKKIHQISKKLSKIETKGDEDMYEVYLEKSKKIVSLYINR